MINVNVTFSDGTIIIDAVTFLSDDTNIWNVTLDDFVIFESSDEDVIFVEYGVMTLLNNWWKAVNITGWVNYDCLDVNATYLLFGNELIYVNIYPIPWDVDVEIDNTPTGIQVENIPYYNYSTFDDFNISFNITGGGSDDDSNIDISTGDNYTIYINPIDGHLISFDLKFGYDDRLMKILKCWPYGD